VYDILLFIPEGICFAVFVAFVACCYIMQTDRQQGKARKPNTHTRIWKLTETQQKQTQIRNCII
jgi:hypothetical protein